MKKTHAGQKLVKKRTKDGRVRGYWMRASSAVKGAARTHGGKVLGAAALLAGAALAHRHRGAIGSGLKGAGLRASSWRKYHGAGLAEKLVHAGGMKLVEHYGSKAGAKVGARIGKKFGKHGHEFGEVLGETLGGAAAGHLAEGHITRASKSAGTRLRKKDLFARPKKK